MLLLELFKKELDRDDVDIRKRSDIWSGRYQLADDRTLAVEALKKNTGSWEVRFDVDGEYDMTGGGSEMEIFASTVAILKMFIDDIDPEMIHMTSEGDSRTKLYLRMLKRLVPNWRHIGFDITTDDDDDNRSYLIATKSKSMIKPIQWMSDLMVFPIGSKVLAVKKHPGIGFKTVQEFVDVAEFITGNLDPELKYSKELTDET